MLSKSIPLFNTKLLKVYQSQFRLWFLLFDIEKKLHPNQNNRLHKLHVKNFIIIHVQLRGTKPNCSRPGISFLGKTTYPEKKALPTLIFRACPLTLNKTSWGQVKCTGLAK